MVVDTTFWNKNDSMTPDQKLIVEKMEQVIDLLGILLDEEKIHVECTGVSP